MLFFSAFETLVLVPGFLTFFFLWLSYFQFKQGQNSKLVAKDSLLKVKSRTLIPAKLNFHFFFLSPLPLSLFLIHWICLKGFEGVYFNNHFIFTNLNFNFFYVLISLSFFVWLWMLAFVRSLQFSLMSLDYFFALFHLLFYLPLSFFSNTLASLFFFIELSSNLILLSFITLVLVKPSYASKTPTKNLSYGFHLIYFQFWSSFFSSLLILYSLLSLFFLFGTSEWLYINLFASYQPQIMQNKLLLSLAYVFLLLGFFLKLGIAPFFAYKLELYQGMPLYSLIFYSLIYFCLFLSIFFLLWSYYLTYFLQGFKFWTLLIASLILLSLGFFLFENLLLRQFFALSSVLTATNLIMILLA